MQRARSIVTALTVLILGAEFAAAADGRPVDIAALKESARNGEIAAQVEVGRCYEYGAAGRPNFAEAVSWYREAAERGHPEAQTRLGIFYARGWGVDRNGGLAAAWFRKAALQGDAAAQFELGRLYAEGEGVPRDLREAYTWFLLARERGSNQAARSLAEISRSMAEHDVSSATARACELERGLPAAGGTNSSPDSCGFEFLAVRHDGWNGTDGAGSRWEPRYGDLVTVVKHTITCTTVAGLLRQFVGDCLSWVSWLWCALVG